MSTTLILKLPSQMLSKFASIIVNLFSSYILPNFVQKKGIIDELTICILHLVYNIAFAQIGMLNIQMTENLVLKSHKKE